MGRHLDLFLTFRAGDDHGECCEFFCLALFVHEPYLLTLGAFELPFPWYLDLHMAEWTGRDDRKDRIFLFLLDLRTLFTGDR